MTELDAAAAWSRLRSAAAVIGIMAASLSLAGCGSGSLLGGDQMATEAVSQAPAPPPKPEMIAKVALAPIIGPPDAVGQEMRNQVVQAGEKNKIGIVADRDPAADYGMRGYLVATRDKAGVKVSYIWDITNPAGKRVNRVTGEEIVAAAPNAKDPWSAVNATVTQTIADKIAASLGAWAPTQPKATPVAAAATAPPAAVGAPQATAPVTNSTTGSLGPVGSAALIPTVTGAPGDGNSALSSALQRELTRLGMPLDSANGYRVDGTVAVGEVKEGKQSIQIDWRVKDAKGTAVGTVTQKNSIPPGSLDGNWGKTADAAAAAAAQGIVKLLPQKSAQAGN